MAYCINCDNKHGCKSKIPPCVALMERYNVAGRAGKEYLLECDEIDKCLLCPFFRSCWNSEEYDRAVRASVR